ncbi:protein of unknown function (plasmid) [Rhodovastum atsumiense]|nr:protein of unknown function [Rhodovastum atsumiense]
MRLNLDHATAGDLFAITSQLLGWK